MTPTGTSRCSRRPERSIQELGWRCKFKRIDGGPSSSYKYRLAGDDVLDTKATRRARSPIHGNARQTRRKKYDGTTSCQDLRRAMPAAKLPPVPFRELGGMRTSGPPAPAAVRRALFDSMRARSDDAADSFEADAPRLGGGAGSTGASRASFRFLLVFSPARAARPLAHSSRASAAVTGSSARSRASSAGRPYFCLRLLSASSRACSTFFSARKRLRARWEWVYGSSL
jgi:hypothetical protein